MPLPRIVKSKQLNGFVININPDKNQFCYEEILNSTFDQLYAMLERYSVVFVLRFDLHSSLPNNKNVSKFFKAVRESLCTRSKNELPYKNHKAIAYQWVKEVEKSKKAHYHCWIALAGRKVNRPGLIGANSCGLLKLVEDYWKATDPEGTVGAIPKHFGHRVYRGDIASLGDCIYHLSYLAKNRGKQYGKGGDEKNHGSSRLKRIPLEERLKRA